MKMDTISDNNRISPETSGKEPELLIWVNEKNEVIGYGEKLDTHIRGQLHVHFPYLSMTRSAGHCCCRSVQKGNTTLEDCGAIPAVHTRGKEKPGANPSPAAFRKNSVLISRSFPISPEVREVLLLSLIVSIFKITLLYSIGSRLRNISRLYPRQNAHPAVAGSGWCPTAICKVCQLCLPEHASLSCMPSPAGPLPIMPSLSGLTVKRARKQQAVMEVFDVQFIFFQPFSLTSVRNPEMAATRFQYGFCMTGRQQVMFVRQTVISDKYCHYTRYFRTVHQDSGRNG